MSETVRVRHDAQLKVTFFERGTKRILSEDIIPADTLDGHILVQTFCYGGVSGYVNWRDPATGASLRGVQYRYEIVNPEWAILKEGELCTCVDCVGAELATT